MNHWQYEQYRQIDEFSRQRIIAEIGAENFVRQHRIYHPGIFEWIMFRFANWMLEKGKGLRRRYEIPYTNGAHSTSRNFT